MARSALALGRGAALAASVALTVLAASRMGTARTDEVDWLTPSAKILEQARREIPPHTWERARCVAVMPAAPAGDGGSGRGVMSCRSGDRWSAPLFLRLTNGSAAFQAGPGRTDLVLLLMNESSVGNILGRRVSLGSGAGVLAYANSRGAFASIDVSSGVLRPDEHANTMVYGRGSSPSTILAAREISAPIEAAPFLRALALGRSVNASAAPDASPGSTSHSDAADRPNAARGLDEDDLRARLLVAQQTIDRILTETGAPAGGLVMAAAAEGGRGTIANGATVSVERARLIQLRQQLDAVLAKLGRR